MPPISTDPPALQPHPEPAPAVLRIDVVPAGGPSTVRLQVSGELDHDAAPLLAAVVEHQLDRSGCDRLVLDLAALVFCNAAGLRAVLAAHELAGRRGCRLRVVCTHRGLLDRLLERTGLGAGLDVERVAPTSPR